MLKSKEQTRADRDIFIRELGVFASTLHGDLGVVVLAMWLLKVRIAASNNRSSKVEFRARETLELMLDVPGIVGGKCRTVGAECA